MRKMLSSGFFVFLLLLVNSFNALAGQERHSELKKAYSDFKSAFSASNTEKLSKIFDDNYTINTFQGGTISGAQLIEMLKNGQIQILTVNISEENLRFFQNTMLVTGRMKNQIIFQGNKIDEDLRFTSLYVGEKGKAAKLVHTQATMIMSPDKK